MDRIKKSDNNHCINVHIDVVNLKYKSPSFILILLTFYVV